MLKSKRTQIKIRCVDILQFVFKKNFLKLKYDDPRIDSLTKNEILIQVKENQHS